MKLRESVGCTLKLQMRSTALSCTRLTCTALYLDHHHHQSTTPGSRRPRPPTAAARSLPPLQPPRVEASSPFSSARRGGEEMREATRAHEIDLQQGWYAQLLSLSPLLSDLRLALGALLGRDAVALALAAKRRCCCCCPGPDPWSGGVDLCSRVSS